MTAGKTSVAFYTLGCKVNFSETSFLAHQSEDFGFQKVRFSEVADMYVIHSCILTSQAEKKTRNAIARAHRTNRNAKIIVMGCVSQLKAEELKKLPGVSLVLGNESKFRLPEILQTMEKNESAEHQPDNVHESPEFHITWSVNDRTRSFLKIQDGCDCYCNYCIVPYARGKSRSAAISEVIHATGQIVQSGFNEIVLTGINLGDFGKNTSESLALLLSKMSQVEGLKRIRLSSLEPQHFTDSLFQALKELPLVMPHFHIPIQSGNNLTLKRMGRTYNTKYIEKICRQLSDIFPDVCIAADIITGFPGETEVEFQQGAEFLKQLQLAYLHVFTFSSRKNTKAATLPEQVHPLEKKRRTARLLEISAAKKAEFYLNALNQIRPVLPESENRHGMMYGFTDNYIRVKFPFKKELINRIMYIQLTEFNHAESVYNGKII